MMQQSRIRLICLYGCARLTVMPESSPLMCPPPRGGLLMTYLPIMLLIGYLFGRHSALKIAHSAKTAPLVSRLFVPRPGVARLTIRLRFVPLVAADAARHAGHRGGLSHSIELAHLAVAHHALHSRLEMPSVGPDHSRGDFIHANPG